MKLCPAITPWPTGIKEKWKPLHSAFTAAYQVKGPGADYRCVCVGRGMGTGRDGEQRGIKTRQAADRMMKMSVTILIRYRGAYVRVCRKGKDKYKYLAPLYSILCKRIIKNIKCFLLVTLQRKGSVCVRPFYYIYPDLCRLFTTAEIYCTSREWKLKGCSWFSCEKRYFFEQNS